VRVFVFVLRVKCKWVHVVQGVSSPLPDTASILGWNSGQANANGVAAGGLMRAFVNLVCGPPCYLGSV
jgi:hypothetical protein